MNINGTVSAEHQLTRKQVSEHDNSPAKLWKRESESRRIKSRTRQCFKKTISLKTGEALRRPTARRPDQLARALVFVASAGALIGRAMWLMFLIPPSAVAGLERQYVIVSRDVVLLAIKRKPERPHGNPQEV